MRASSGRSIRESRRPRPSARAAVADAPPKQTDAATRTVWLGLLVLTGVRAAAAFVPGMWLWGDVRRFLSPVAAWLPWMFAAVALIPAVGRMLAPPCEWLGRAIVRGGPARAASAVLAGVLAWSLPDQVHYVGDFLMREGTVEAGVDPSGIWPQAQPLDVLLHYTLPRALELRHVGDALQMSRVTGAIEAALLAWLAIAFARAIAARGAAALAIACTAFFGGTLGLFTGYGKAFSELIVLVAAAGVLAVRIARGEGGIIWLGAVTALAVALHRSASRSCPCLGMRGGSRAAPPERRTVGAGSSRWARRSSSSPRSARWRRSSCTPSSTSTRCTSQRARAGHGRPHSPAHARSTC
jgi:hypothetical protein